MDEEKVLKGVYRDGGRVASVLQREGRARIMLKGVDPAGASFLDDLKKVADGCRPHVQDFAEREICLVLADPAPVESVALGETDLAALGVTRVSFMDAGCGIVVRALEAEPPPIPLSYGSLRPGETLPDQPGIADVPAGLPRRSHKDLSAPQKKVYEAAAQVAGRGILRLLCVDDQGLQLVVTVKDAPPPRARTVLVPLGRFADDLAGGAAYEDVVKRLARLRT